MRVNIIKEYFTANTVQTGQAQGGCTILEQPEFHPGITGHFPPLSNLFCRYTPVISVSTEACHGVTWQSGFYTKPNQIRVYPRPILVLRLLHFFSAIFHPPLAQLLTPKK
jgi:hypothetical protein